MKPTITPKDLATALGVSESSVKRWADEGRLSVSRTAGGHRRIAVPDAVRFVRALGTPLVRPGSLGLTELSHLPRAGRTPSDREDALYHALESGDAPVVRGLLQAMYVEGASLAVIVDGPLRAAMQRIGELYQHQEWGIVIEHRASDIAICAMNQLRLLIGPPSRHAPIALGGAPGEDPYILPSLAASAALAEAGFRDINLGPRMPLAGIEEAALRFDARLVFLSLSIAPTGRGSADAFRAFASRLERRAIPIALGGRASREYLPPSHPLPPGVTLLNTLAELSTFARGLTAAKPKPSRGTP
ncbi:MAG: B12-binding domain-containing protein [Phycisphaerales bacterium]